MKQYYDNKKYYINRAMKIAKKCNNEDAIRVLTLLNRHDNIISVECAKEINKLNYNNIDLFDIENK